ncbi:hypothetical protein [Spirosoma fluminis]
MKTILIKLLLLSGISVALTNCSKKEIVPQSGLSQDIRNIVPQTIIDDLRKRGMVINEGAKPPKLDGVIYADPYRLVSPYGPSDAWREGKVIDSYHYKFYGQTADNKITYDYTNGSDKGKGNGAFVAGNGNLFTIFSEDVGVSKGINYKTVTIMSGEVTDKGVQAFQYAFVMTEKTGEDPTVEDKLIAVGNGRIWDDGDQLAEWASKFPQAVSPGATGDARRKAALSAKETGE